MKKVVIFLLLFVVAPVGAMYATMAVPARADVDWIAGRHLEDAPGKLEYRESRVARESSEAVARRLLRQWSPYVERVYGTSADRWATAMKPSLRLLTEQELRRAEAMPSFDAMMAALDRQPDIGVPAADMWEAKTRQAAQVLGQSATQFAYNMVAPCRLADTRISALRMRAGSTLNLKSSAADLGSQGGEVGGCGIPPDAQALIVNVAAVDPAAGGYLSVFPYGAMPPLAASLNYMPGQTAGNEIIARQTIGDVYSMTIYSWSEADVVVDVVGYFVAAPKVGVTCSRISTVAEVPPGGANTARLTCPSIDAYRYTRPVFRVGGGCQWLRPDPGEPVPGHLVGSMGYGYECNAVNSSGKTQSVEAMAICCSVSRQ